MSSYQLTHNEGRALSYGLDHHIPSKTNPNLIYTEFKSYFQSIKYEITNLPEIQICHLKTKLCYTCEQYNNIKRVKNNKQIKEKPKYVTASR